MFPLLVSRQRERERERPALSLSLSFSFSLDAVIALDLKPRPPPTGTRIVIVSEIADPKDSHRHRRPPFSLLSSSIPSYYLPCSSRGPPLSLESPSRMYRPRKKRYKAKDFCIYSNFSSLLVVTCLLLFDRFFSFF